MSRRGFPPLVYIPTKNFGDLSTKSFEVKVRGRVFQGFVVRKGEKYYAYENVCQHLPVTLDLNDNHFFNHEKTFLQCHMHGAMYEIESGLCVDGPCVGAKLVPLELTEEEGQLVITIPEKFSGG